MYGHLLGLTMLKGVSNKLWKQAKGLDPPDSIIGIGSDLGNWMPDTDASSHFTPCLEGLDLGVEVADGHIVKCTARGIVEINMIADDGLPFKANLHGVINVPGLKRHHQSYSNDQASIHTCYQARTGHLCGYFTTSFC